MKSLAAIGASIELSYSGGNVVATTEEDDDDNTRRRKRLRRIIPLDELTGGKSNSSSSSGDGRPTSQQDCPKPLIWANDIWRPDPYANGTRRIPRYVHLSMKSRCLPQDLYPTVTKWSEHLPQHSVLFHDDDAVDRLLYETDWPEFPHLTQHMNCILTKGAMKIDVWRLLVVYRYGGIYSDIDGWPNVAFSEDTITPTDQAVFMSDAWARPSQAFFVMEPGHPIAFIAIKEVLNRLSVLGDIVKPKVVFVTGPDVVKHAYGRFLNWKPEPDIWHKDGTYHGKFGRTVRKVSFGNSEQYVLGSLGKTFGDIVPWNATVNMTKRERSEAESGVLHWRKQIHHTKQYKWVSCEDYLFEQFYDNTKSLTTR